MNLDLLRRVRAQILAEPTRVDMGGWVDSDPECGTIGCIAGHAVFLAHPTCTVRGAASVSVDGEVLDVPDEAQRLLDLTEREALELFTPTYIAAGAPGTPAHAAVVAAHIDRFIAEHVG